jgi:CRP/FNR family cyclic AMP-dependent transcriptional regulator
VNPANSKNILKEAIIDCLSGITIFADLDVPELNTVSEHMHVSRLETGDIVFSEGDPGDDVCFVVDGILDVWKSYNGRLEKKIAVKAPGGSIGEMAVVGNFCRTATVKARTDTTLLTLSRERLNQICDIHPGIGVKILRAMARLLSNHLRDTSQELLEFISLVKPIPPLKNRKENES